MLSSSMRPFWALRGGGALELSELCRVLCGVRLVRSAGRLRPCERPRVAWQRLAPAVALLVALWRLRRR